MASQNHANRLHGMYLSSLITFPMALRAAINLNVFQIIADSGPESLLSPSEIVSKMPTTNPQAAATLDRLLRVLAANNVLTMSRRSSKASNVECVYGLTSGSRSLVKGEDGVSMAPLVLLCTDRTMVESCYRLDEAVLEGGCTPFVRAHGKDVYGYASAEPSYGKFLQEAMSNCTTIFMKEVFKVYEGFHGLKKIVDVGGGIGTCLSLIVSKYPHIQGFNFDLPQVISHAPQLPGVEHVAGNMFEGVPCSSEAIFMRGVLHNWDDDRCVDLLKNCWGALPNGGIMINVEFAVPETLGTDEVSCLTYGFDLLMMSFCSGGKERTRSEYGDLAKAAGFAEIKFIPIIHGLHVMEFHKTV